MLFSSLFVISFLPIFLTAKVPKSVSQYENLDASTSFLCDRKLYLSKTIKLTLKYVTGHPLPKRNFQVYQGNLQFNHKGPIYLWPLPVGQQEQPWKLGNLSSVFVVLGGLGRQFLGVIHKLEGDTYAHCIEAKAGGIIKSIVYPDGVFKCRRDISDNDAVNFAQIVRDSLQKKHTARNRKYPIYYEGDLEFPGQSPHLIWPIAFNLKVITNTASQFLVTDMNFNVVDAFMIKYGRYERCKQVYPVQHQVSIHIAPVIAKHSKIDTVKTNDRHVSAQQVLQAAKNAHNGFHRKRIDPRNTYPTPYCTIDLNIETCDDLYLWPVQDEDQKIRQPMTTSRERFLLVIDHLGDVHDVVANLGGMYQTCKRLNFSHESSEDIFLLTH